MFPSPSNPKIRDEYIHVPAATYCQERAKVLRGFLTADSIFATVEYREKLEASARANVEAEVGLLDAGSIPGRTKQQPA